VSETLPTDIVGYHAKLTGDARVTCERLAEVIAGALPEAKGRVWHGHPVWFLEGNPVVGYSARKVGVRLLFWSGQSFTTPGLRADGKFKTTNINVVHGDEIDDDALGAWLGEARTVQWDYANIVKRRGVLERLG
jgi:hypothetical protein